MSKLSKAPLGICWAVSLVMLALSGCNSSDQVSVSGKVTLDGNPVSSGRVEFYPEKGRPAVGQIDAEGRYELSTNEPGDGVLPGKYVVAITARTVEGGSRPPEETFGEGLKSDDSPSQSISKQTNVKWLVPRRYSNRKLSGLTAVVSPDNAEIDFNLVSKQ